MEEGFFTCIFSPVSYHWNSRLLRWKMAIGRASRKSISSAFQELDKEGQHGTIERYVAYAGNFYS